MKRLDISAKTSGCARGVEMWYRHRAEGGFGLIELMIAMLIAMFLVLGLAVMAQNMQVSFTTQAQYSVVHDKERFASALFANVLQSAGYFTITILQPSGTLTAIGTVLPAVPTPNGSGGTYATGQYIYGTTAATGATAVTVPASPFGAGPDQLNVRFEDGTTSAGAIDTAGATCLGAVSPTAVTIYESVLSIDAVKHNLLCQVGINGAAPTGLGAASSTVLIDGVCNMQVAYGVATQGGINLPSDLEYYRAADMSSGQWANVSSVKIQLTLAQNTNIAAPCAVGQTTSFTETYQVMYDAR
ncbi:MAG: PilW family protein [Burkholderiaceae bacterium]|nr:PilW family protein [Burkholderiaceae bacterium]